MELAAGFQHWVAVDLHYPVADLHQAVALGFADLELGFVDLDPYSHYYLHQVHSDCEDIQHILPIRSNAADGQRTADG